MAILHDKEHVLVITHTPEGVEYELLHPDCPVEMFEQTLRSGEVVTHHWHACSTGGEVMSCGLEFMTWDVEIAGYVAPDADGEHYYGSNAWKGLPDGRYLIAAWGSSPGYPGGDWDGGLELLGKEGEVEVAA